MAQNLVYEKLFSYGTLQLTEVQQATFGRKLQGTSDSISGFRLEQVEIKDQDVISKSGACYHPIITYSGDPADKVSGMVFDISLDEILQADLYEVSDYKRIRVTLNSGNQAWVYIKAHDEL